MVDRRVDRDVYSLRGQSEDDWREALPERFFAWRPLRRVCVDVKRDRTWQTSMPIVPAHTLREQTSTHLLVSVTTTKGASTKPDLFTTDAFIRLSAHPCLLELDLYGTVEPKTAVATQRGANTLELRLEKKPPNTHWPSLTTDLPKLERTRRRNASVDAAIAANAERASAATQRKWDDSRFALRQQMEHDRAVRSRIEEAKSAEKAAGAADLRDFAAAARAPAAAAAAVEPPHSPAAPPPRRTGTVKIKFTPKLLPAPMRTKGTAADAAPTLDPLAPPELRAAAPEGDLSQRDPAWLKARGDQYLRHRDYSSAESAYAHVLAQFGDKITGQAIDCVVGCYSNRALCRLSMARGVDAAADCTAALAIVSKARCVTDMPMSDEATARRQLRLTARRASAHALAGRLRAATADLTRALALVGGAAHDPSAVADAQHLSTDLEAVASRRERAAEARSRAAAARKAASGVPWAGCGGDESGPSGCEAAQLGACLAAYDEAVALEAHDATGLVGRAECCLALDAGDAAAAAERDTSAALLALDADESLERAEADEAAGRFPPPATPDEITSEAAAHSAARPATRFEALRVRAVARVTLARLADAATDLKAADRLRPSHPAVLAALDDVARRAAASHVDLTPSPSPSATMEKVVREPPAAPPFEASATKDAGVPVEDKSATGTGAAAPPMAEPAASPSAKSKVATETPSTQPSVGTRSALQLKSDADSAFRAGKLERAIELYGQALRADAASEWVSGPNAEGVVLRCQCLANRAACHLKRSDCDSCVDDATAAITALAAAPTAVDEETEAADRRLLLKLLARRGMALGRLQRLKEAREDYAEAVRLRPEDESLRADLRTIEAAMHERQP